MARVVVWEVRVRRVVVREVRVRVWCGERRESGGHLAQGEGNKNAVEHSVMREARVGGVGW